MRNHALSSVIWLKESCDLTKAEFVKSGITEIRVFKEFISSKSFNTLILLKVLAKRVVSCLNQ